jgi:hypothetical protein
MTAQMPRIRVGPESGATGRVLAANVTVKKENIVDAAAITVRAKRRREEEIKQLQVPLVCLCVLCDIDSTPPG